MMAEEEYRRRLDEYWAASHRRMRAKVAAVAWNHNCARMTDDLFHDLVAYTYERRDLFHDRLSWLDKLLPLVVRRHLIRNERARVAHSAAAEQEFVARTRRSEDVRECEIQSEQLPQQVRDAIIDSMRANDDHSEARAELIALVHEAVASADQLSRTIYQRLFVEGESVKGLAARLGISARSVSSAKAELIDHVARRFADHFGEDVAPRKRKKNRKQ